jgi:hypothetical protein
VALLVGLLILDLVGFLPGALVASVVAAAALLAIDPRGLVTLNGLIKWRWMGFRLKLLALVLAVALFQFLVIAYLAQRLFGMAKAATAARFNHVASNKVTVRSPVETRTDPTISPTPLDADAMQAALHSLLEEVKNRLPQDMLEKVRAVASAVDDILPAYRAGGLDARDRFAVERTVDDYLPNAVRSYLRLPVAYRSSPLSDADGRTANEVLSDQLDLLFERMSQVVDTAYRKDVEAFLVHGRFLQSKFGPSSLRISS